MSLTTMMKNTMKYLSEGVARIFSPRDDHYPETGVQPFEGDPVKHPRPGD